MLTDPGLDMPSEAETRLWILIWTLPIEQDGVEVEGCSIRQS